MNGVYRMNLFTKQLRVAALSAMFVVGAVCTSGSAEKPAVLVGQWVYAEGYRGSKVAEKSMEMFSDGTGVVDGASMTWKVENKRLMILTSNVGIACDYKVSGYELYLAYDDDKNAIFVKKGKLEEYKKKKEEEKQKEAERVRKEAEQRIPKISGYFTDSRNGRKYRTVNIGGKTWMAENVNYQAGNSWCYEGDNSNCEIYGRLYDWNTAKTVCPAGWHLPSRAEWGELAEAVGGILASKALKSTYGWDNNGNGTDVYGFSALPGGFRHPAGSFGSAGTRGYWWAVTEWSSTGGSGAYQLCMYFDYDDVNYEYRGGKDEGVSVRCVRD